MEVSARSAEHRREAERKGKTYRTRKEEEAFFALHREAEKENNRGDAINTSAAAAAEAA